MRKTSLLVIIIGLYSASIYAGVEVGPALELIRQRSCSAKLGQPAQDLLVVIALGNKGYTGTRHNVGEDFLTTFEQRLGTQNYESPQSLLRYDAKDEADAIEYMNFSGASSPVRNGLAIDYRVGGRIGLAPEDSALKNIIFVHPYYDINESGHFVTALMTQLGLTPKQLLVIVDDITLARNQFVLSTGKPDGTGDGHNGLKSINKEIGSGSYLRLRIGVSNPKSEKLDISRTDWVLGPIPEIDRIQLFSDSNFTAMQQFISNLQQRLVVPEKEVQKLVGEGNKIIKTMNQK